LIRHTTKKNNITSTKLTWQPEGRLRNDRLISLHVKQPSRDSQVTYNQGRRQKNFQRGNEKRLQNSTIKPLLGGRGGNSTIKPLSTISEPCMKIQGGRAPPADAHAYNVT